MGSRNNVYKGVIILITANGAKIHSAIANSTKELEIRFKQWLQFSGVGSAVINVAKAGGYSYTFGIPNRFVSIAEDYLEELGYKVTMLPEKNYDPIELYTHYVRIDWRD